MHLCLINWGVHLPAIYMHCLRSSSVHSGIQGIYAQLTGEDLCLIALCYANIFGVAVFNACILDLLGVHLHSIYMHCPRSSNGCSSMQGIYAWMTGEDYAWMHWVYVHCLYIYRSVMTCAKSGVAVFKASMLDWLGVHLPWVYALSIYIEICHEMCQVWCSGIQGIYAQLTEEDVCSNALGICALSIYI